ncbi:MAG: hypothetical protein Q4D45_11330 [Lachnospiraceae bacterium]|nr:hypothetical protein [Lachnospiraceae bacterium]
MKKGIWLLLFASMVVFLIGCLIKGLENDKNQLLEVTDSNDNVLSQTTDNDIIEKLVKKEKIEQWMDIEKIPDGSQKLYTFHSYEQIENSNEISYGKEVLYKKAGNYYIESVDNNIDCAKIPHVAGNYLMEFAQHKSQITNKEDIFSKWQKED